MTVNNENLCVYVLLLSRSVTSDSSQPHKLYSPPGSSVHGILQARIWCGLPCSPPGDLPLYIRMYIRTHTHIIFSISVCVCVCLHGKNPRVHSSSCELLLNISSGYFLLTFMVFFKNKVLPFIDFFFSKFIFGRATQQAESYFPDQRANPAPLQWKC